ncbi:unnamed protein product [Merluccius merluccius]
MGDHIELQITPETPGKPLIRNPFESPNDYHHLHELLVPSPSVFKHCKATPAKFDWAIEEMASLLPVDINSEDIQRQSVYLSQTMIDTDIEEKRQHAIEQFFTKGTIVPSPWAAPVNRKTTLIRDKTMACQTTLSLPVALDLEKILGEYHRSQDVSEAVQECLSSSSLRRKLFLDGQGSSSNSGSDNSSPSSPERNHAGEPGSGVRVAGEAPELLSSFLSSPLACDTMAPTPSTGQFSSSPIQHGRFRDHSLGSMTSPMFPDRSSPAGFASPSFSPIGPHVACTPIGERKQLSFLTPDGAGAVPVDMDVNSCSESPYVEGCSPIRNCSPHQLSGFHSQSSHPNGRAKARPRARCWASPPLISPILNPKLHDSQVHDDPLASPPLASMDFDPSSPAAWDNPLCNGMVRSLRGDEEGEQQQEEEEGEEEEVGKDLETPMEGRLEDIIEREEEEEEEEAGEPLVQLTSSRMGNVSTTESYQMYVSLLAEGSSIRCYDSSMQVDSGYNGSVGTASLIDGLSSVCNGKESFSSNLPDEPFPFQRQTKVKVMAPVGQLKCCG